MSAREIIFVDERGRELTVNLERFMEMLNNSLVPEPQNFANYNQRTWL